MKQKHQEEHNINTLDFSRPARLSDNQVVPESILTDEDIDILIGRKKDYKGGGDAGPNVFGEIMKKIDDIKKNAVDSNNDDIMRENLGLPHKRPGDHLSPAEIDAILSPIETKSAEEQIDDLMDENYKDRTGEGVESSCYGCECPDGPPGVSMIKFYRLSYMRKLRHYASTMLRTMIESEYKKAYIDGLKAALQILREATDE